MIADVRTPNPNGSRCLCFNDYDTMISVLPVNRGNWKELNAGIGCIGFPKVNTIYVENVQLAF
jgi:hypothetical protein